MGDQLHTVAYDGYYNEAEEAGVRDLTLPIEGSALAFGERHLIHCELDTQDQELRSLSKLLRIDELAAFPLRSRFDQEQRGVLVAGNTREAQRRHPRVSEETETLNVLSALSSQVATCLDNIDRYEDLAGQKKEVERANTMKSAFLATMSHELRTPLNAIIGFTRLVMRKGSDVLPEKQIDNLAKVERAGLDLLGLINDILDLSKVEAGRMQIVVESVDLVELVRGVVDQLQPLADRRDLTLGVDIDSPVPSLMSDGKRLRQIVTNLVSNALKFTTDGAVVVGVTHHPDQDLPFALFVRDTGIGIEEKDLERIFEPFHQTDSSMTRTVGGTGLGLAIARQMAALLGGRLGAESTVGVGSCFTLRLGSVDNRDTGGRP